MRALGQGHSGLEKFTSLMGMPKPMTQNNYDKLVETIGEATKEVAEETMSDAANELREKSFDPNADNGILDIGVSCDGSWQRRGFSSLNGVVTVISIDSGKVLDIEAMNRSCKACCLKKTSMAKDPLGYADWRNSHICKYNYQGSVGGMESVGATRIFQRSVDKHNFRYKEFLGDGDSKSFCSIKNIYPGMEVKKT